jgi:ABC-type multidrug transport system permease subunit
MKALILGIVITAAAVFAGFIWWGDVLSFLRGALPVIAAFAGLIAVFVGIMDIRDRGEAKKEETAADAGQE